MSNNFTKNRLVLACLLPIIGMSGVTAATDQEFHMPSGTLYFTGLSDEGWQIFSMNLPQGKRTQLTHSSGDKRESAWLPSVQKLVARNSIGDVVSIDPKGGDETLCHFGLAVANFSFFKGGDRLLMTHLISKAYRKQWIYEGRVDSPETKLFAQPVRGSYRSVRLSPDGLYFACTLIQTYGEERLVVGEVANPSATRLLTSAGTTCGYPAWNSSGKTLYFSMRCQESNSWDLCSVDIADGQVKPLLASPDVDELAPFAEASDSGLFFHSSGKDGFHVGYLDLKSLKIRMIDQAGIAREPCFVNKNPGPQVGKP